jgi:hypothetical protein
MILRPKNWSEYQHYKDRNPPWIKLHRDLLNDRDFMCLPIASKAIAPLLWLLASEEKSGDFNANVAELAFRLRMTEKEINDGLKPLISKGFFVDASGVLAECLQVAIPETERETEKEVEKKPKTLKTATQVPELFIVDPDAIELAKKLGVDYELEKDKFCDYYKGKGTTMKDWSATFRNWIRNAATYKNSKPYAITPVFDGRLRGAK